VSRKSASDPGSNAGMTSNESKAVPSVDSTNAGFARRSDENGKPRKAGSWREIEARREKTALKASLADVWDEDFNLDDEILAELDHTAEYFTPQSDAIEEVFEEDLEGDDFYDEDEESN